MSLGPTISMANDWRTGMSTAFTQPSASASATTIQTWTRPLALRIVRMMARTIIAAWAAIRV